MPHGLRRARPDMERLQADVDAGFHVTDQRRSQPVRKGGRDQQGDLAVDMLAHLPDQVSRAVHCDCGVLGKEVAGVEGLARVRVDQRVVVCGVGFGFDLARRCRQPVCDRTEVLWQAVDAVAVLCQLALAQRSVPARFGAYRLAARDQFGHARRSPNLTRVRLKRMDIGIETLVGGKDCLRKKRCTPSAIAAASSARFITLAATPVDAPVPLLKARPSFGSGSIRA